jgi:hypothetical protein
MIIEAILAPFAWLESNPKKLQKHVIIYIRGIGEKRAWPISQVSITLRSFDSAFGLELLSHRMDDLLQLLLLFF